MKLYAGIDLHSNNSVVSILDEADHIVFERRLDNDLERIKCELGIPGTVYLARRTRYCHPVLFAS
jgi:hypothetical protein